MLFFNTYCFETNFNHVFVVLFLTRHTIVVGNYGFMLDVRVSVRPLSIHFSFPDDNLSKQNLDFHQTWYVH